MILVFRLMRVAKSRKRAFGEVHSSSCGAWIPCWDDHIYKKIIPCDLNSQYFPCFCCGLSGEKKTPHSNARSRSEALEFVDPLDLEFPKQFLGPVDSPIAGELPKDQNSKLKAGSPGLLPAGEGRTTRNLPREWFILLAGIDIHHFSPVCASLLRSKRDFSPLLSSLLLLYLFSLGWFSLLACYFFNFCCLYPKICWYISIFLNQFPRK
jgi:hypothetical protein